MLLGGVGQTLRPVLGNCNFYPARNPQFTKGMPRTPTRRGFQGRTLARRPVQHSAMPRMAF